ncbi:MAG TPA: zinc ribbon domain-containing protein [Anaerolineales bacterium]
MEIPRHWRLKAQRYRLEGSVCPTCGRYFFPPRPVCHQCFTQAAQNTSWKLPVLQISSHMLNNVSLKEL